ncbi:MAG: HupE/UreJ family protein [Pseudomonadota bacterium]
MNHALRPRRLVVALFASVCAGATQAHTGLHGTGAFSIGFMHPLTGMDHLLAMLALGVWACSMKARTGRWVMLTFPAMMAVGFMFGKSGDSPSGLEAALAGSVAVLVLMILAVRNAQPGIAAPMVAFFGLLHGWAHGMEMPADAASGSYAAGFLSATIALHLAGFLVARQTRLFSRSRLQD